MKRSKVYTYEGPIYIRPMGRGIMLETIKEYLSDALTFAFGCGAFNVEITVIISPRNEEKQNEEVKRNA